MSLLTTLNDGRTYDVMAFRGQQPVGEVLLAQDFLAGGGQVCTGILKLAQWFTVQLCTIAGTGFVDTTSGTTFFAQLATGRLQTETDVFIAFSFAVGSISAMAKQIETATTPSDEQFANAVLDSVTVSPGIAKLHITLTSQAGSSRAIILPIPVMP